jgi:hypothetical protein
MSPVGQAMQFDAMVVVLVSPLIARVESGR